MRWKDRMSIWGFALACFAGCPAPTSACSCWGPLPACEAFGAAAAVFIGRVEHIVFNEPTMTIRGSGNRNRGPLSEDMRLMPPPEGEVRFTVEESFVGTEESSVSVFTGRGGGDCGYPFKVGDRYLVYANRNPQNGHLRTSICSNTQALIDAGKDLEFLRQLPPKGSDARISGRVMQITRDEVREQFECHGPMKNIRILVTGEKRHYEVVTDTQGQFNLKVPGGQYEVHAVLPDYFDQEYLTRKLEVNDRGCATLSFNAQLGGRISGRVYDPFGTPARRIEVSLIAGGSQEESPQQKKGVFAWTDQDGAFELKRLVPGRYLLGINLVMPPNPEQPYPPTYYPGETDPGSASIIMVGLGQQLGDHNLHLPPKLAEKAVQGSVVWPDGQPVQRALVSLDDLKAPYFANYATEVTDDQGRFRLRGYVGRAYKVQAFGEDPNQAEKYPEGVHAEPLNVTLNEDVTGIRLVLMWPGRN